MSVSRRTCVVAMFRQLGYAARDAARGARRNRVPTSATILVTAVTLVLVLAGLVARQVASLVSMQLGANVRIVATLRPDLSSDERAALLQVLRMVRGIETVSPPSDEDLRNVSQLTAISRDPDATLVIVDPVDSEPWQGIAVRVRDTPGVAGIEMLGLGSSRAAAAAAVADVLFPPIPIILSVAALVLLTVNARLTIAARREETDAMRLVGAANWYVRLPFVLEGLILGLAGGLLAVACVWITWSVARASIAITDSAVSTVSGALLRWSLAGPVASALVGGVAFLAGLWLGERQELRASERRQVTETAETLQSD